MAMWIKIALTVKAACIAVLVMMLCDDILAHPYMKVYHMSQATWGRAFKDHDLIGMHNALAQSEQALCDAERAKLVWSYHYAWCGNDDAK